MTRRAARERIARDLTRARALVAERDAKCSQRVQAGLALGMDVHWHTCSPREPDSDLVALEEVLLADANACRESSVVAWAEHTARIAARSQEMRERWDQLLTELEDDLGAGRDPDLTEVRAAAKELAAFEPALWSANGYVGDSGKELLEVVVANNRALKRYDAVAQHPGLRRLHQREALVEVLGANGLEPAVIDSLVSPEALVRVPDGAVLGQSFQHLQVHPQLRVYRMPVVLLERSGARDALVLTGVSDAEVEGVLTLVGTDAFPTFSSALRAARAL